VIASFSLMLVAPVIGLIDWKKSPSLSKAF